MLLLLEFYDEIITQL